MPVQGTFVVVITKDIYIRYVECTYVANINALGKTLDSIRLHKHERTKSISDNQRLLFTSILNGDYLSQKAKKCYGFKNLNI